MQKRRKAVRPPSPPNFEPERIPGVGIEQWRKTTKLVEAAMAVMTSAQFPLMLEVLRRSSPGQAVLDLDASVNARVALQCRAEGWNDCLKALQSLGTPWIEPETVPETFADTNFGDTPQQAEG